MLDDRLGVLSSTSYVVEHARHVAVDRQRAAAVAEALLRGSSSTPVWDAERHFADGSALTANYVLVLDALNFCFWSEPRWRVEFRGQVLDGYWALAAALKRSIEEGIPLLDARYLADLTRPQLEHILRGEHEAPLLEERLINLREAGQVLLDKYDGQFARAVEDAGHSAIGLVQRIVVDFPSFDDVARYDGRAVRLYKRAQICVADLYGAYRGRSWGAFDDLDQLTAFADYKLPQMLRQLGIISYARPLADQVDAGRLIEAGGLDEVEIRAATIWGVEHLRRALSDRGRVVAAFEVDWFLWDMSQSDGAASRPYHRTRTIYY